MFEGKHAASGRLRGIALAALLTVTLAACGDESPTSDADQPAVDEVVTEVSVDEVDASPAVNEDAPAVDAPENINVVEVTIADGRLDPSTIQVEAGVETSLQVTNEATAHELAITDVVDSTSLAAGGTQAIDFTAPEDPGEFAITLDGENAGTLDVQDAAGAD